MIPLLPLIIPWLSGAGFLLIDGRQRWAPAAAATVLLAVLVTDVVLLIDMTAGTRAAFEITTGEWPRGVGIRLDVDRLALFFATIITTVLAVVLWHECHAGVRSRLLPALILLMTGGLHGAFFTGDLFNFYVFFELSVMCSFALAAYGYGRAEVRGTFVYMTVNIFGTVLFLIGVAVLYHTTGTLDYEQLAERTSGRATALLLPAALLFVALSIKLGLFPFHGWVPVVYTHASPAVAAAFSGALVNIGAYGLLRLGLLPLAEVREQSCYLLSVLGVVAILYGALLAVRRTRPAELAAYISIAHAGFVVLALGAAGPHGITALLLVALSGSLDKTTLFLSLDSQRAVRYPIAFVAAASVAGIPVTIGFFSKVQLVRAAIDAPLVWVVVPGLLIGAVLTIAAVVAFWRLSRRMQPIRPNRGTPALALAVALIALGVFGDRLGRLAWEISMEIVREAP